MKTINRLAALLLTVAALSYCATSPMEIKSPTSITTSKMGSIDKGATTREELIDMFGRPDTKIPSQDGMTYFWKDANLSSLWVVFNDDWTVADFEYSE